MQKWAHPRAAIPWSTQTWHWAVRATSPPRIRVPRPTSASRTAWTRALGARAQGCGTRSRRRSARAAGAGLLHRAAGTA
eukprot:2837678-Alexandrium_andersonii.AAC.1